MLFSSLDEKARRDIAAYARPRSFATGLKNAIHVGHSTGGGEVVDCIARHGESRGTKGSQAIPEPFPKIKRYERQGQSEPAGKKPIPRHRVTCESIDRAREIFAALYHIRIFELGTTRAWSLRLAAFIVGDPRGLI